MLTVKQLLEECEAQVAKGNGNKNVYISRDDEGNGFHALYYTFEDDIKSIKQYDIDYIDEEELKNIVLLG